MKKYLKLLLLTFLITSCNDNTDSNLQSNDYQNSFNSTVTSVDSQVNQEELLTLTKLNKTLDVNFYNSNEGLTSSYQDKDIIASTRSHFDSKNLEIEENYALFNFDNVSSQASLQNYPVFNAYKEGSSIHYITMLSETDFDIQEVEISLSLWKDGEFNNVGDLYSINLQYYKEGEWEYSESISIEEIPVFGSSSNAPIVRTIPDNDVRLIRLCFELYAKGNVRFVLENLKIKGQGYVSPVDNSLKSLNITNDANILSLNDTVEIKYEKDGPNSILVDYYSNNRSIATIDERGILKGIRSGQVDVIIKNGAKESRKTFFVVEDASNYSNVIQSKVDFIGEIPQGFSSNFETYYNGAQLNFKKQDDYVLTPLYPKSSKSTTVVLTLASTANNEESVELSKKNIFTVQALNENKEVIEEQKLTNWANMNYEKIKFTFSSINIVSYKIIFELKYTLDMGSYFKTGKNICMESLEIYENK